MIELLASKFIKDKDNVKNSGVRKKYGVLSGGMGIFFNMLLFIVKLFAGIISGSVSIIADAFNNLGDAGSSAVMIVGFRMADKKPDEEHPFGHGRVEYVTGLVVSLMIILMAVELIKSSAAKIISPADINLSLATLIIITLSVLVKLYMYYYNHKLAVKLNSATMRAAARDSLVDSLATFVVMLSMLANYFIGIKIDGYCGMAVALFILYTGVSSARDTIDPLLGSKPDPEFVRSIEKYVTSYEGITGVHDLIVHDYGPGRIMISLHAEVPANADIIDIHDTIDNIERKLAAVLGCHAVIHMDPIVTDDDATNRMKSLTELIVKGVDESYKIHDFRMVKGPTHTNLIFDVVIPYDSKFTEKEVSDIICSKIKSLPGNLYAIVDIDRPLV